MDVYILTNNDYDWNYIPKNGNTQSQIILSKIIDNQNYIYNFNGDITDLYIGKLCSMEKKLFGIYDSIKHFKRIIMNPYEIHIVETGIKYDNNSKDNDHHYQCDEP